MSSKEKNAAGSHLSAKELQAASRDEQSMYESEHLSECVECSRILQEIRALKTSSKSLNCLDRERLVVLAGIPGEATQAEIAHLAQCSICSTQVKEARIDFEELSPELLNRLESSKPDWQSRLAKRMAARNPEPRRFPGWKFGWIWVASAVIALTVFAVLIYSRGQSLDSLMGKAYSEHRVLELRFSGVPFASLAPIQRGDYSHMQRPALLHLEVEIAKHDSTHDPKWLQAKARADLLEGNYEAAIRSLQRDLQNRPDSLSLLTDLAIAYFQRGEANDRAVDYGTAAELLSKALSKSPNDPVILFNRGVVYYHLQSYESAAEDFRAALNTEKDEGWRKEGDEYLTKIKEKKTLAPPL